VKEGRAHVYAPMVGKQEATRFEIKNLVGRFFKNSHELLVLNILEDKSINADELKRLSQLLQEQRGKP
jgi:predicted transcriptional regulator